MAASPERRQRYTRQPQEGLLALTPSKLALLRTVAEYEIASLPQLAALVCPSPKSARRHLRELYDHGLVEVVPVARVALAEPTRVNDASLLYGSAPNIYVLTGAGHKVLRELELAAEPRPRAGQYGPRNSLFLSHELAIRDVRVWLELVARARVNHQLEAWRDGTAAEIDLQRPRPPKQVRPDAWFTYRLGQIVLVGLLEVDRGTERGGRRWQEKLTAYDLLFQGTRLKAATGYSNARVLVITPDSCRRDHLAEWIAQQASSTLAGRFWLADRTVMKIADIHVLGWRQPGRPLLRPLIPGEGASTKSTGQERE